MPNGGPRDGFFYPTLTLMIDSYNNTAGHPATVPEYLNFYLSLPLKPMGQFEVYCSIYKIVEQKFVKILLRNESKFYKVILLNGHTLIISLKIP